MNIVPFTNIIEEYLKEDTVINYKCESITKLSNQLYQKADNELEYIRMAYEYVRDNISHSADINADLRTCTASEVLEAGHGICFAKSHLLAALLRAKSIPTGFCYQKLILDDETAPVLIYHGLNGVYISELKKWIRLDARGNKEGVNAQFSLDTEQLAFPIRPELGEVDGFVVYPEPDVKVLERLRKYDTRSELWENLPTELGYGVDKIVAACGNDCSSCPRYIAHPFEKSDEQLQHTAELWMKIGYRDHIVSNEEISCTGCKPENWCRYKVVKCCEDRGIKTCAECIEYPCANMKECFEVTKSFEPQCRKVCIDEEYEQLKKAFFEKEKNLDRT